MEVRPPRWYLTQLCPICSQGSSLLLVACPRCRHIAVACEEEGSFFEDLRAVAAKKPVAEDAAICPQCHASPASVFVPATDVEINDAGLRPGDYE
jgi:hypothetical protein